MIVKQRFVFVPEILYPFRAMSLLMTAARMRDLLRATPMLEAWNLALVLELTQLREA